MKIADLKLTRSEKIKEMGKLVDLASAENRNMSEVEQTTWRSLETEVKGLDSQIDVVERQDKLNQSLVGDNQTNRGLDEKPSPVELIKRSAKNHTGGVSINLRELNKSFRDRADVADVQADTLFPEISVFGKEPADFAKLGVKVKTGVKGLLRAPYVAPAVGKNVAENAAITENANYPTSKSVALTKVAEKQIFTYEEIGDLTVDHFNQLLADLKKGIDRKLTANIYNLLATDTDVTAVAAATALDRDSMLALEAAVDGNDVSFYMERASFYEGMGVAIDTGSGKFLFSKENGQGVSDTGTPVHFNSNFADAVNTQFVYAAADEAVVLGLGDYYMFTDNTDAGVVFTLVQMHGLLLSNPNKVKKSADMDPAV
jgi:hypothetical protein